MKKDEVRRRRASRTVFCIVAAVYLLPGILSGCGMQGFADSAQGAELPAVVAQHQPSVVAIDSCTGTYLGGRLVLSAWHILDEKRDGRVTVKFHNGPTIQGKIVSASKEHDQATILLNERPEGIYGVPLATETPKPGAPVVKAGYVKGKLIWHVGEVLGGTVSCGDGSCQVDRTVLSITPYSVGGQSGGPIFDARTGRLIGNLWGSNRGRNGTNSTVGVSAEVTAKLLGAKVVEGLAIEQTGLFGRSRGGTRSVGEPNPPPGGVTFEEPPAAGLSFGFGNPSIGEQISAGIERLSALERLTAENAAARDGGMAPPSPYGQTPEYGGEMNSAIGDSRDPDYNAKITAAIEQLAVENESQPMWENLPTTWVSLLIVIVLLLVLLYVTNRQKGTVTVVDVIEKIPTALAAGAALTPEPAKSPVVAEAEIHAATAEQSRAKGAEVIAKGMAEADEQKAGLKAAKAVLDGPAGK